MAYVKENDYPLVCVHESDAYALVDLGKPIMEFCLTYTGPLLAARDPNRVSGERIKNKYEIRKHIHKQLVQLWSVDTRLVEYSRQFEAGPAGAHITYIEALAKRYQSGGINWLPLVNDRWGAVCSLDVLFLRHEPKGGIIHTGDLDNRIKTLFDALTVPTVNGLPDSTSPQEEPNPFYCLLSDDKLIAEFKVTADRWLVPSESKGTGDADVQLVVKVRTFIGDHEKATKYFGGHIHA